MTHPLAAEMRKLLGRKFRHLGRGPTHYDCAGACKEAWESYSGKTADDLKYYGREPHRNGLMNAVVKVLGPPVNRAPQEGDIVMFRFDTSPHHLGVVGSTGYGALSVIHASGADKKVVEHIIDRRWYDLVVAVFDPGPPAAEVP